MSRTLRRLDHAALQHWSLRPHAGFAITG